MGRRLSLTLGFTLLALGAVSADDQWPQFRGTQAERSPPSVPARDLERNREHRVEDRHPRIGLELAGCLDDHILSRPRSPQARSVRRSRPLRSGDENGKMRAASEHRFVVYDVDFNNRKILWQRELIRGLPRFSGISRTASRRRHRSPTASASTSIRQRRRLAALDLSGKAVWTRHWRRSTAAAFGTASSPALYRDRLSSSTTTPPSRSSSPSTRNGRGTVARQARGSGELVDAVRLGERAANRDRHCRLSKVRSTISTASCLGALRMT